MKKILWILGICVVVISLGALAFHITVHNVPYGFHSEVAEAERNARQRLIHAAESWLDSKEGSENHLSILDIYNSHTPLAQGYLVQPEDNWCATFVSTCAIQCDYTDIIPTECGCQRQIGLFEGIHCWMEDDAYLPLPGDIIYYSSYGSGFGDCTAWSDHVGIVVGTWGNYIKVIEGNCNDTVAYRYIPVNHASIRGYAIPDYSKLPAE